MSRPLPAKFGAKAVGVSFVESYPANLTALREAAERAWLLGPYDPAEFGKVYGRGDAPAPPEPEPLAAVLRRNPDNEHDPNAVQVHVPALGDVGMIGHLPAAVAARLAPEMDAGQRWAAEVTEVLIHPDHPDRPGISLNVHRVPDDD